MEELIADALGIEFHGQEPEHAFPFAEDDNFGCSTVQGVAENVHRLADLHIVPVLQVLIDDEGTVGQHAHLPEHEQEPTPLFLAEVVCPRPFAHQSCHRRAEFFVPAGLLGCHGDEQELVCPFRQLQLDALLCAADECVFQLVPDVAKVLVTYGFARFGVCDNVVVAETVERREAVGVGELHNGAQFVQIVLERRA